MICQWIFIAMYFILAQWRWEYLQYHSTPFNIELYYAMTLAKLQNNPPYQTLYLKLFPFRLVWLRWTGLPNHINLDIFMILISSIFLQSGMVAMYGSCQTIPYRKSSWFKFLQKYFQSGMVAMYGLPIICPPYDTHVKPHLIPLVLPLSQVYFLSCYITTLSYHLII